MLNVFIQFFLQIFAFIFITHISTKEKRGSNPTNTVSTTLIHDSIENFFHKKGNAGHIASQGSKGWGSNPRTVLMNCLFSIYLGYINVCITLAGPLKELAPTELPSLWRKLLDTSVSEAERQSDPYDLPFRLSLSLSFSFSVSVFGYVKEPRTVLAEAARCAAQFDEELQRQRQRPHRTSSKWHKDLRLKYIVGRRWKMHAAYPMSPIVTSAIFLVRLVRRKKARCLEMWTLQTFGRPFPH